MQGKLECLTKMWLPQPQCKQGSTNLIQTITQVHKIWKPVAWSLKRASACSVAVQTSHSTFSSEENQCSFSVYSDQSSPMYAESPQPFHNHRNRGASDNKMKPSGQTENFCLSDILSDRQIEAENGAAVEKCFEKKFQSSIYRSRRPEVKAQAKLYLMQRPT